MQNLNWQQKMDGENCWSQIFIGIRFTCQICLVSDF